MDIGLPAEQKMIWTGYLHADYSGNPRDCFWIEKQIGGYRMDSAVRRPIRFYFGGNRSVLGGLLFNRG